MSNGARGNGTVSDDQLIEQAVGAMRHAYMPYSHFPVGAALLTQCGKVFTGCNVENASYGATICAERSAIVSAVSSGYRHFTKIAVATQLDEPGSPCGICRQFLVEFGPLDVLLVGKDPRKITRTSSSDLLPLAFTPKHLQDFQSK